MTEPVNFLLVDDLPENLLALEALLRRDGLRLLKAQSGDEALELLLRHDVALALLDVQMPGLDGFELAELMRGNERGRHIPIIFLTAGSADAQRRFRGYEAGAVDFIYKPIEPDILHSKANVFFDLYRQRQHIAAQRDALEAQRESLKQLQQLTQQQLDRERETARLREEFVAILGHDLRNPVAAITSSAAMLRRQPQTEQALKVVGLLESTAGRMARLIDNVLDFARQRLGGGIAVDVGEKPLQPVLRQLIAEMEASHPDREFHYDVRLEKPLVLDDNRIGQLVANLLSNAVSYGDPKQPVELKAWTEGAELHLTVANAGPPIPDAAMERLFQPFFRGDLRPNQKGLGLGLHIASEIARAHGGRLEGRSEGGRTCFTLVIPALPAGADTERSAALPG